MRADAISDDNSYFSPMTRSMTLGTGGVDDGEDADVIVHEYGHSLQDQAVHNFGVSRGGAAVGEGFGDYLAASMSALTTGGSPFDACIFDWDAASYSPTGCGRRADKPIDLKTAERKCRHGQRGNRPQSYRPSDRHPSGSPQLPLHRARIYAVVRALQRQPVPLR